MSELIAEGYYDVKVKSFGADLSKEKKTPYAWVKFDNELYWTGYFSKTVLKNGMTVTEKTIEQLLVMGFNGSTTADLNSDGALNVDKPVNVSVSHTVTDKGAKKAEVSWVNAPYKKKELDPANTKVLAGMDLRAYIADAKKNLNLPEVTNEITTDEIPF